MPTHTLEFNGIHSARAIVIAPALHRSVTVTQCPLPFAQPPLSLSTRETTMQAMQKYNLRAFRAGPSPKLVARAPTMTRVAKVEADIMADGDSSSANMMSFEELTKIIKMVQDTDIVDIELKGKRFSLAIKKQEALKAAEPVIIHQAMPTPMQQYAPAPMAPAPAAAAPAPGTASGALHLAIA